MNDFEGFMPLFILATVISGWAYFMWLDEERKVEKDEQGE